jgi:hypothetical protein
MTPPNPPPRSPLLRYLPAIYPPNEEERKASLMRYSPTWSASQENLALALVKSSQREFGVSCGSISLIDTENEIFKIEIGYQRRMIARSESIAAHALLTTEVLVVLDTAKVFQIVQ